MPIYEYICRDCQHRFEVLTTSSQATVEATCPLCGSSQVTKAISAPAPLTGEGGSLPRFPGGCGGQGGFS